MSLEIARGASGVGTWGHGFVQPSGNLGGYGCMNQPRKRFDYFVYPNRDHGLSEGKGSLAHVRMLIARYLIKHLSAGPR